VLENCSVTRLRTLLRRTVPTRAIRIRSDSGKPAAEASVKGSVKSLRDARMKAMNCRALRTVEVTEWLVARKSLPLEKRTTAGKTRGSANTPKAHTRAGRPGLGTLPSVPSEAGKFFFG
jgi:hypothetical protein